VTVSVSQGAVDSSSWDHISYVASQIVVILAQTIGVMYIGQNAQIRVSISKATQGILSGTNLTATS